MGRGRYSLERIEVARIDRVAKNLSVEQIDELTLQEAARAWNEIKLPGYSKEVIRQKGVEMLDPNIPTAFISYSWDDEPHRQWVKSLAKRLRSDGVDVKLDQWEAIPGDQLTHFMETAIRDNQYVLIICTPNYREKSDARSGGAGYEGDIMSAELFTTKDQRKFIPILRGSNRSASTPTWLSGKYSVDLSGDPYSEEQYHDLLTTIHQARESAPPIGRAPKFKSTKSGRKRTTASRELEQEELTAIKIEGVLVDEVGEPPSDGTRGSALYEVPFKLSRSAPTEWAELFIKNWNSPPQHTNRHRPGIAKVSSDRIFLTRTTIEEVKDVHRETLKLVVNVTNNQYWDIVKRRKQKAKAEAIKKLGHAENVRRIADELDF